MSYLCLPKSEKTVRTLSLLLASDSLVRAWDYYQAANRLEAEYANGKVRPEGGTEEEFKSRIVKNIWDNSLRYRIQTTWDSLIAFMQPEF